MLFSLWTQRNCPHFSAYGPISISTTIIVLSYQPILRNEEREIYVYFSLLPFMSFPQIHKYISQSTGSAAWPVSARWQAGMQTTEEKEAGNLWRFHRWRTGRRKCVCSFGHHPMVMQWWGAGAGVRWAHAATWQTNHVLQFWDISSPVNADYAKQEATLPGPPRFNFTLTIKVSAQRMFYDHTESEKMRDTTEGWGGGGEGSDGGKNRRERGGEESLRSKHIHLSITRLNSLSTCFYTALLGPDVHVWVKTGGGEKCTCEMSERIKHPSKRSHWTAHQFLVAAAAKQEK